MSLIITGREADPLLLDSYSGAAVAYSLRQLSWAYGGPAVRVRRDSNNAEQDFTATEVSDGTLATWVGTGNNGFVTTWYDQSGNGGHATQTSTTLQPQIVSSGALITKTGKPVVSYSGGLKFLTLSINSLLLNRARVDAYIVKDTSDTEYILFNGATSAFSYVASAGNSSTTLINGYGTPTLYANGTQFTGSTRADIYTFLNGYKVEVHQNASTVPFGGTSWGYFDIGSYERSTGIVYEGTIQELIFYTSDQSAKRSLIEANINAHYSIYP